MGKLNLYRHIHFVGIGGAGMSAIASVLIGRGFQVSGSDLSENRTTANLARGGATIYQGHRAENIKGADLIVLSTAIRKDNPERQAAETSGKPVWHRAEALAGIMATGRSIAVAGTHGKTTTTTMLGQSLYEARFGPTVIVGAWVNEFGGNALTGRGEWIVAEADESDGSLLQMEPDRVVITNIEADHLDYYRDLEHVAGTFEEFIGKLKPSGKVIACLDCPEVSRLRDRSKAEWVTYAVEPGIEADLTVRDLAPGGPGKGFAFTPVWRGERLGRIQLRVPGLHNVSNALAVLAIGLDLGATYQDLVRGLEQFKGASRRFEVKGRACGATVVDDYAHHPTELRATLAAAKSQVDAQEGGRVVAVFQPHRFTRTKSMAREFGQACDDADVLIVTEVYAAGEDAIDGVSGLNIAEAARLHGHPHVYFLPTESDIIDFLKKELRRDDLLLTLGAGDVYKLGERLVRENAAPASGAARTTPSLSSAVTVRPA